jgi:hypothetical protein
VRRLVGDAYKFYRSDQRRVAPASRRFVRHDCDYTFARKEQQMRFALRNFRATFFARFRLTEMKQARRQGAARLLASDEHRDAPVRVPPAFSRAAVGGNAPPAPREVAWHEPAPFSTIRRAPRPARAACARILRGAFVGCRVFDVSFGQEPVCQETVP